MNNSMSPKQKRFTDLLSALLVLAGFFGFLLVLWSWAIYDVDSEITIAGLVTSVIFLKMGKNGLSD